MALNKRSLFCCTALLSIAMITPLFISSVESRTALASNRGFDDAGKCQLKIYKVQSFQGNPDKIISNRRRRYRHGHDNSLRSIGTMLLNKF